MRGSSPRMMKMTWRGKLFLLDNIPRCMYIVTICSKKEAVIRKPHLFMSNVEQLPSVPGSPRHLGRYGWRWERCRASAFRPPAGGHQTHSVNHSKLTEVGTSPTL